MRYRYLRFLVLTFLLLGFFATAEAGWTVYEEFEDLISNYITTLHADRAGNIWFGTEGQGVEKYDGSSWSVYAEIDGLINNSLTDINSDPAGNLWFASTFGVGSFDGVSTWDQFNQDDNLLYVDIKTMVVDDSGFLWLGTFGAGVVKHDADTLTIAQYTADSGLADNNLLCSMIDRDGNIWFGTRGGVSKLDPDRNWTTYDQFGSGLLDNAVYSMIQDPDGNYWFGSDSGLSRFDGVSQWATFTNTGGDLAPGAVTALAADSNGYIWVGHKWTDQFQVLISRYDGSIWEIFDRYNALGSNATVSDIAVDTSGIVWIATTGDGLTSFEHEPLDTPDDNRPTLPAEFTLSQNYPNPFNSSTSISFSVSFKTNVEISIYNVLGQQIRMLVEAGYEAGTYTVNWDGADDAGNTVPSGIYFYEIKAGEYKEARKMVLMK